jgi:hypothetical protein
LYFRKAYEAQGVTAAQACGYRFGRKYGREFGAMEAAIAEGEK